MPLATKLRMVKCEISSRLRSNLQNNKITKIQLYFTMKNVLIALSFIAFFTNCNSQKTTYNDEIKQFQYQLNTQYADAEKSPLTKEGLKTFKSLDFFEINAIFNVEATFELTPNAPIFEMQTTTNRLPLYRKYGIAKFTINGKKLELSIYG